MLGHTPPAGHIFNRAPASICFGAAIIPASGCLLLLIPLHGMAEDALEYVLFRVDQGFKVKVEPSVDALLVGV